MRIKWCGNRRGVILLETVVSLSLMGVLVVVTSSAIADYHRARQHYLLRQAAAWAAEAQLQRYVAGAAIDSAPPAGMIPEGIMLSTAVDAGEGGWAGFDLVTVTARAAVRRRRPIVERAWGYFKLEPTR